MVDDYVGVQDSSTPSHYVDNERLGDYLGVPLVRQRIASVETTGLVPKAYDAIDLTYNGDGTVATVTYRSAGVTVAILTLGYDNKGNVTSVVRT